MPAPLIAEEFFRRWNEMCVSETQESVTSISTSRYVPQPIENRPHFVCNRLFVGGFPPGTTSKQLSSVFSSYGTIISCNVLAEDASKNYGFVTFQETSSAEAVMEEALMKTGVFQIGGCLLKIKRALFKPKRGTCSEAKHSRYRGRHDVVKFYGGTAEMDIIMKNIRSFSNLPTVVIPILPNSAQSCTAGPFPPPPPVITSIPIQNYMQPAIRDNTVPSMNLNTMMIAGPYCFPPSGQACMGGFPPQWQAPKL